MSSKKALTSITLLLTTCIPVIAGEEQQADSSSTGERKIGLLRRIIRGFDYLDENYIEPQHYVFTAMLQGTYTYDLFRMSSANNQSITFAPDGSTKAGPYFGWKWLFAGYTFSLGHSNFGNNKTEIGLSLYSSQIGVDLVYRRTGNDYKLRDAKLGNVDTRNLEDVSFDGIKAGITGISAYYIFNHGRFSYPAAFAQSTCQKISCGSWLLGLGYMKNTLDLDYEKLQTMITERLSPQVAILDSGLICRDLQYHDLSVSGGYAYNWVFARDWLFCASGQVALGYKNASGDAEDGKNGFSINNFSPNMVGRFSVVYNNMRWYAGFCAYVYSNTYRQERFSTNNTFGSMNMYIGYNFGLKKKYRKDHGKN
jgi:hypothetical protein